MVSTVQYNCIPTRDITDSVHSWQWLKKYCPSLILSVDATAETETTLSLYPHHKSLAIFKPLVLHYSCVGAESAIP